MNLGGAQTLELELWDEAGDLVTSSKIELPVRGHSAIFITETQWSPDVDLSGFSGTLRVEETDPVAATVILAAPDELATLPVATPQ